MPIHSVFLKYFDEVRRCGSIRLAARRLYVASSAVNRQILKIENELGVRLFERSPRGIQLTSAGELLARHVTRTLNDAEQTLAEIALLKDQQRRIITIAAQESVIARFLPPVLMQLYAQYPDIATVFRAASGNQLLELLSGGGTDIALAFDAGSNPDIRCIASIELPVGAVMTPGHPLAARRRIALADCLPYPIVLPDRSWPLRERLDRLIVEAGVRLNIMTSSNSVEFLKTMVDQQLGIGFQTIVGIEAQVEKNELVHVLLADPQPLLQSFALYTRSDHAQTALLNCVLELLRQRLSEYAT
jgi:DNA-binding transcriptional LysR family regulator